MGIALALPNPASARLPAAYEAAKQALANCASIDECQSWADKAEALASYARQADDETLRKQADRIQARAIRRCGELLKQFNTGPSGGRPAKNDDPTVTVSQKQAASDAGISERQRVTAVRVANVPAETFEHAVESETPPTVTNLADMGRKPAPARNDPPPAPRPVVDLKGRNPADFNKAMHFEGMIRDYVGELASRDLDDILPRLTEPERTTIRALIAKIDASHDAIVTRI